MNTRTGEGLAEALTGAQVVVDIANSPSRYFGAELTDQSLVPCDNPRIGSIDFESWFSQASRK